MMKPILSLLLLGLAMTAQAATYECTDRQGRRTYTNTSVAGQNCRTVDLGRPSIYSSAMPSVGHAPAATAPSIAPTTAPSANAMEKNADNSAAIAVAENRLNQARQNLEQGRQVRYGNERNYARYLERIKGLENEVAQAQQELNTLKQPAH